MFREAGRNTRWVVDGGYFAAVLFFGFLDAPFDVADCFEVLVELAAVAWSQSALEIGGGLHHGIQNASLLSQARQPRRRIRAATVAEQPLEHCAGIVFHGQGCGFTPPGDGGVVDFAEARVARAP